MEHGFAIGLRSPEDFLRHFSPMTIMRALAEHPTRRARILEETVGLRPKIALRKSPQSSGEDLQIALDEGESDAATVLRLFEPDDRIRFLDNQMVWAYVVEPRFWAHERSDRDVIGEIESHTAFIVTCGLDEGLLTAKDVVNAVSVPTLVEYLPRDELSAILERALLDGRDGVSFSDEALLAAIGIETLVERVPLSTIWEWVIGSKIAAAHGLAPDSESLFDEAEAHPDAQQETVMIDPDGHETVASAGASE